jgi:hypothetical protein
MATPVKGDKAKDLFNCTDSERAVFEAGIKLGGIYHQFIGATVTPENVEHLERTITEGTRYQPFVEGIEAHIDRTELKAKSDPYDYQTVTGKMLSIRIVTRYGNARAVCELKYLKDMRYPLMYVKEVTRAEASSTGAKKK